MKLCVSTVLAGLLLCSQPAQTQSLRPDFTSAELVQFATAVRTALARGNVDALARHVLFPLRVDTTAGVHFVQKADFIGEYPRVFTTNVKAAILEQDLDALEASTINVKLGNGVVLIESTCTFRRCEKGSLRIVAIDLRPQ